MPYERHQFEGLVRVGGRIELLQDPRFLSKIGRLEHIEELYREFQRTAATMTTEDFLRRCRDRGVPAHAVTSLDDVVAELPLVDHPRTGRYRLTPSLAPGVPIDTLPERPGPLLGEHGREVLEEVGYTESDLDELEEQRVLGRPRCGSDNRPEADA